MNDIPHNESKKIDLLPLFHKLCSSKYRRLLESRQEITSQIRKPLMVVYVFSREKVCRRVLTQMQFFYMPSLFSFGNFHYVALSYITNSLKNRQNINLIRSPINEGILMCPFEYTSVIRTNFMRGGNRSNL